MQIIELSGIRLLGHIGCTEEEQLLGNEIEVSVKVSVKKKDLHDDLKNAVDYQKIFMHVKNVLEEPKHLLETVSEQIAQKIADDFPHLKKIRVKVSKLNPPLNGTARSASVTHVWKKKAAN